MKSRKKRIKCRCKKAQCTKYYCLCYRDRIPCTINCKCIGCYNGRIDLEDLPSPPSHENIIPDHEIHPNTGNSHLTGTCNEAGGVEGQIPIEPNSPDSFPHGTENEVVTFTNPTFHEGWNDDSAFRVEHNDSNMVPSPFIDRPSGDINVASNHVSSNTEHPEYDEQQTSLPSELHQECNEFPGAESVFVHSSHDVWNVPENAKFQSASDPILIETGEVNLTKQVIRHCEIPSVVKEFNDNPTKAPTVLCIPGDPNEPPWESYPIDCEKYFTMFVLVQSEINNQKN